MRSCGRQVADSSSLFYCEIQMGTRVGFSYLSMPPRMVPSVWPHHRERALPPSVTNTKFSCWHPTVCRLTQVPWNSLGRYPLLTLSVLSAREEGRLQIWFSERVSRPSLTGEWGLILIVIEKSVVSSSTGSFFIVHNEFREPKSSIVLFCIALEYYEYAEKAQLRGMDGSDTY